MNALDLESIHQNARLARKSKTLFSRIKAALTKPWQWDSKPSCFLCGVADSKEGAKPRCNDAKYNEGYANGMQAKRRRNPKFNKEILR